MSYKCFAFHYYSCRMPIQNLIWRTTNIIFLNTCIGIILLKMLLIMCWRKILKLSLKTFAFPLIPFQYKAWIYNLIIFDCTSTPLNMLLPQNCNFKHHPQCFHLFITASASIWEDVITDDENLQKSSASDIALSRTGWHCGSQINR